MDDRRSLIGAIRHSLTHPVSLSHRAANARLRSASQSPGHPVTSSPRHLVSWSPGLLVSLSSLALLTLFVVAVLLKFQGDPRVFVNIGARFDQGIPGAPAGSDGQYPYYIATEGLAAVPKMDPPAAYRYQRILYPVLAAALALGQRALVPWTLLLINLLATGFCAGALAYLLARRTRLSPWWALLAVFWAGSLISVRYDMTDPLAIALSLAAILFYDRQRIGWAAVMAALAGLTKDAGLVLVGGLVLHALWTRHWRPAVTLGLVAAGPYLVWAWLVARWLPAGLEAMQPSRRFCLIPFCGLAASFNSVFLVLGLLWLVLPTVFFGALLIQRWRQPRERQALETWLLGVSVAFMAAMPPDTFRDLPSALRYAQPFIIVAILYWGRVWPRRAAWLLPLWGPTVVLGLLLAFTAVYVG